MKSFKKLFTIILTLSLMISCFAIPSFAAAPHTHEDDSVEILGVYPACDHNYIVSPVGHLREVYDSDTGMYGYAQDYIHRCTKCGEYYYTTSYVW